MSESFTYVYVGLSGLSLLIAAVLLVYLLRKVLGLFTRSSDVFGVSPRIRLISFGSACLLSPSTIPTFLSAIAAFIVTLFKQVANELYEHWKNADQICGPGKSQIGCVWFQFLDAWDLSLGRAYDKTPQLPFTSLLVIVTFWSSIALVLTEMGVSKDSGSSRGKIWLRGLRSGLKTTISYNLAFFLLLASGGYLSIAAIAAIPGLQEKAPITAELTSDKLKQQLEGTLNQFAEFSETLVLDDPFDGLDKYVKEQESKTKTEMVPANSTMPNSGEQVAQGTPVAVAGSVENRTATSNVPVAPDAQDLQIVKADLATQQGLRQQLIRQWKDSVNSTKAQLKSKKDQAVSIYVNQNSDNRGSKERVRHFLAIDDWLRSWTTEADSHLTTCSNQIERINQFWKIWADDTYTNLKQGRDVELGLPFSRSLLEFYSAVQNLCRCLQIEDRAPDRPRMGSDLGPFTVVAKWLLQTESLSLALITGLLGFGLLGSACSTFVREHSRRQPGQPIVKDLQGVLIRGLSAAIVIFLAVEGGLAMFAGNNPEPNPYVLLFTCLVAAVFSEDVWKWAHGKLRENLGGRHKGSAS